MQFLLRFEAEKYFPQKQSVPDLSVHVKSDSVEPSRTFPTKFRQNYVWARLTAFDRYTLVKNYAKPWDFLQNPHNFSCFLLAMIKCADVDNNSGKRSRLQKPVQRCSLNPGSVDPARAAAVKDRTYLRARLSVKNTKDQITWRKSAGFSSKLNESLEKNLSIMLIKEIATQIKMISCFHARCHNSITDAKWTLIVLLFHSKIGLPVSRAAN